MLKTLHSLLKMLTNLLASICFVCIYFLASSAFSAGARETLQGNYVSISIIIILSFLGTLFCMFLSKVVYKNLEAQGIVVIPNTLRSILTFSLIILAFVVFMTILSFGGGGVFRI